MTHQLTLSKSHTHKTTRRRKQPHHYHRRPSNASSQHSTTTTEPQESQHDDLPTPPSSPTPIDSGQLSPLTTASLEANARILAAKREGNLRAVMTEFTLMRKQRIPLTHHTYNLVLDALASLRKEGTPLIQLLKVYDEMARAQIPPSSYTYTILIRILCKRDVEVQKTIAMLRRQAARMCTGTDDIQVLESERNLDRVITIFQQAAQQQHTREFQVDLYNQLLRVLSHYGDKDNARFIYNHLVRSPHAKPNSATFAVLINLYGRAGDMDMAIGFYNTYHAQKHTMAPHDASYVYNALVDAYLKCNRLAEALSVLENDMVRDDIKVNIIPYNSVIRYYCTNGAVDDARRLVDRLRTTAAQPALPRPDASSYGPILSAYCQANQYGPASEVYTLLLTTDITKAYGNLANYALLCLAHHEHSAALAVIRDMQRARLEPDPALAQRIILSFESPEDAVVAYTTIIEAMSHRTVTKGTSILIETALKVMANLTEIGIALRLFNVLKKVIEPTPAVHCALIDAYSRQNKDCLQPKVDYTPVLESAMAVDDVRLPDVAADLVVLHYRPHPALYSRVLSRLEWLGLDVGPWKSIMPRHKSKNETESLSSNVLRASVRGHGSEAVRLLEHMLHGRGLVPVPEMMRDAIDAVGKQGDLQSALRLYELCCESGYNGHALYLLQNSLLVVYAQQGDMVNAQHYYDAIKARNLYPDGNAYASLLLGSARCATDEATDALTIYFEAKRHNVKPTTFFYNVVISKLAKARKLDPALKLFEEMENQPNYITYCAMISACVRAGSETHAQRLFGKMLSSASYQPRVGPFNNMIQLYVRQHPNRERALKYVQEMRRRQIKPSAHTYKLLMEAYATIAPYDMPTAHRMLTEMVRRDKITPLATHYATLIYSYGLLQRDVQSADQVFLQMNKANVAPDEAVYQALLDTLITNGRLERAEELYEDMAGKVQKSASPYIENLFIRGYGQKGDMAKAEKIFNSMSDNKLSKSPVVVREPSTYEVMVKACLENDMLDKAKQVLDLMVKREFPSKVLATVADLVLE